MNNKERKKAKWDWDDKTYNIFFSLCDLYTRMYIEKVYEFLDTYEYNWYIFHNATLSFNVI